MKGNDDAEHAQELPADFESKGFRGGDQSAEDGYGTAPAVPCEPNVIAKWKKQALADLPEIFRQPHNGNHAVAEAEEKRRCIAPHPHLTLARQCGLLGLPRST